MKNASGSMFTLSLFSKPNLDKPVGAKRKSRFIGEPKRIETITKGMG